jgi:hypothetical protein
MLHRQELFIVDIHTQQITLYEQSGVFGGITTGRTYSYHWILTFNLLVPEFDI